MVFFLCVRQQNKLFRQIYSLKIKKIKIPPATENKSWSADSCLPQRHNCWVSAWEMVFPYPMESGELAGKMDRCAGAVLSSPALLKERDSSPERPKKKIKFIYNLFGF